MIKWLSYIVWLLCLCLLVFFSANAFAAAPLTHWNAPDFPNAKWTSPDEGCTALVGQYNAGNPPPKTQAFCRPPHSATYVQWFNPMQGNSSYRIYEQKTCADGSKPNLYVALNIQCPDTPPPDNCPPMEQKAETTYLVSQGGKDIYSPLDKGASARNSAGCKVDATEVVECYSLPKSADPTKGYCTYVTQQTGGVANESPMPVTPPADTEKDRGNTPQIKGKDDGSCPRGTVNVGLSASGIPMCVGNGTKPTNAPAAPPKVEVEKNETLPDGSTQNTKSVTTKNADGSTTTVKTVTVTKAGGEKEITQEKNTTATPGGKPGKETENPVAEKNDLCKQNPNLAVCKNSTVGGKCGETSCTGDAIQCATLRATAILQCKAEKDEADLKASPLAAKGQSAMDGKDMEGLPGPKNGLVVNVASMKSEGWLGNGAAFEDVSVSIRGQEILIPLSKWSSYLLPFRYMLMIIASLISYRIIAGSVLKE